MKISPGKSGSRVSPSPFFIRGIIPALHILLKNYAYICSLKNTNDH